MLADNRTDKVIGRIIFLVTSTITIKLIRAIGVPFGTVWAIILVGLFFHPNIIIATQITIDIGNVNIIWAFGVKVNGAIAMIFLKLKKVNKEITIKVSPFLLLSLRILFISFTIKLFIIFFKRFTVEGFFSLSNGLIAIGIKREAHARDRYWVEGSKVENKLFIMLT